MLFLSPHNKVSLTFPRTFHFNLLSYTTFYFSLSSVFKGLIRWHRADRHVVRKETAHRYVILPLTFRVPNPYLDFVWEHLVYEFSGSYAYIVHRVRRRLWTRPFTHRSARTDRVIAQGVSLRFLAAEAWVQSRGSPCGICGWQCSTGAAYAPSTSVFPCQLSFHQCWILMNWVKLSLCLIN
jgi:hypothetical protein